MGLAAVGTLQDYVYVSGNFWLSPAEITRSNMNYNEYPDWAYCPIEDRWYESGDTRWSANVSFEGNFIGATLAEAQAMGAPFAQKVPEPSTLVLLVSLGIAGIALCIWRRRK
jgi:hypothetical protein